MEVVGAPGSDVPTLDAGEVFIHERTDGTWSQVERLQQPPIPDLFNFDFKSFGVSVAVEGNVIVVGALSNYWADTQVSHLRELTAVRGSQSWPWHTLIGPDAE